MTILSLLAGLFGIAFVAATLLPAQSELALAALIVDGRISPVVLVVVATAGNVLGSVVNWLLGRFAVHFQDRRWFPVSAAALGKASAWYHRWGRWSLLASWVPVIGDPLTVAAGVMREPLWSFVLLVTLAKAARYVLVAMAALNW